MLEVISDEQYEKEKLARLNSIISKPDDEKLGVKVIVGTLPSGKKTLASEITDYSGKVTIEGVIFSCDSRDLPRGSKLYKFEVVDDNGDCIGTKIIVNSREYEKQARLDEIKPNAHILIYGEAQYDKYVRETVLDIKDMAKLPDVSIRQDNAENKRVELHLHTKMSAMDGLSNASDLVKRAKYWGMKAMAITDHGIAQSFPDAQKEIGKDDDFKLIFGVEGYLTEVPESEKNGKQYSNHIILLAKNQKGLFNLYKLVTYSHTENFYKKPRIDKAKLLEHREGLILGSACELGELFRAVYKKDEEAIKRACEFYDYFEIMPVGNNKFMIEKGYVKSVDDLHNINKRIYELGKEYGKPVVATGDVHFLDEKDAKYRAILQAGQGYPDADKQADLWFKTTEEMLDEFAYLGEKEAYEVVVENSQKIADMCDKLKPVPDGKFPPGMENSEQELTDMCHKKAEKVYGSPLPDIVKERMDKELNSINSNGYSVMYLIAQRLVKKSNEDGYLVGSRGSVGSSLVAFLSDITEVNSLAPHYVCPKCKHSDFEAGKGYPCGFDMPDAKCPKCGADYKKDGHEIPFETFLGFKGDKEPDIDLNFSGEYQSTAHKYVGELFGEENCFKAGTISTIASRTAYGFVKKYLEDRGEIANNAKVNYLVNGCTGVKRTTGQHPGGIVVLPKGHDINEFCPVQYPADDKSKSVFTTHFDYHSIQENLLKLDMLGHDDPTVIKMLEEATGIDSKTIPMDDKQTLSIFTSTKALGVKPDQIDSNVGTFGVPEFGTGFVRKMLEETKPTTFGELVRISGLSHGTDVWINNAQALIAHGEATLKEAICTRDDIMTYLIHRGLPEKQAFDIMERVRKGKGLTPEDESLMQEYKIPAWYIDSCNKIKYMFPKAHASAYVTMAFRIAWFKVHYPLAFYLAYFSVRADEFDINLCCDLKTVNNNIARLSAQEKEGKLNAKDKNMQNILQVAKEMFARGFEFLPVDVYESESAKFKIEDGKLRPPFTAIAGLGSNVAEQIVIAREEREFSSVDDLRIRGKVNKTVLEALENQGCFAELEATDQMGFL